MQDAKSFIARVGATRAILATTAGRPGHEGVVDNERAELLLLLGGITVRGQDAAAVIAAIKGAALPGDLEEVLISRLCKRLSEQPTCSQQQAKMPCVGLTPLCKMRVDVSIGGVSKGICGHLCVG